MSNDKIGKALKRMEQRQERCNRLSLAMLKIVDPFDRGIQMASLQALVAERIVTLFPGQKAAAYRFFVQELLGSINELLGITDDEPPATSH